MRACRCSCPVGLAKLAPPPAQPDKPAVGEGAEGDRRFGARMFQHVIDFLLAEERILQGLLSMSTLVPVARKRRPGPRVDSHVVREMAATPTAAPRPGAGGARPVAEHAPSRVAVASTQVDFDPHTYPHT